MKKLWILALGLSLVVAFTAACSNGGKKSDNASSSNQKTDTKSEMMTFYMNLVDKINAQDSDLNAYESAMAQDPAPTGKELKDLQTKAATSAQNVADTLKDVKVPSSLKKYKSDLDSSLKDFQDAYQMKADQLKQAKPNLTDATNKMTSADDTFGKVCEKAGLQKSSVVAGVS